MLFSPNQIQLFISLFKVVRMFLQKGGNQMINPVMPWLCNKVEKLKFTLIRRRQAEEATYLWHIDKTKDALRIAIEEIELCLTEMKQTCRQAYIKNAHVYFSRIKHDYTDAKKGFVEWKGILNKG